MIRNILIGGVVLLLIIVVGGTAYFYTNSNKKTETQNINLASPTATTTLANPASQNCATMGGQTVIKKRGDGGEYGLCEFAGDMACEEWALMRGDCPKGGVKTTGFDTEAQKYCAWSGGQTLAVTNAQCNFKDGTSCSDQDLYDGKCSAGSSSGQSNLLDQAKSWAPQGILWSSPQQTNEDISGKNVVGQEITGTLTTDKTYFTDLGEKDNLLKMGWKQALNLQANGPMGAAWGYTKGKELLYFSFTNKSFKGLPEETKCPCNFDFSIFYSNNYQ